MKFQKFQKNYKAFLLCFLCYSCFLIFIPACKPDRNIIDPADYELYISLSADKYPSVSPDGSLIAYYHQDLEAFLSAEYPTGLYVMDINGNNRKLIIQGDNYSPSWSPDNKWLVFSEEGIIKIINLEGTILRTFTGVKNVPLFFPDWSSDGRKILINSPFVIGGGVFVSTPLLDTARQLLGQSNNWSGFSAQWTHEMDKLIYEKVSNKWHGGEIFLIDTSGIMDLRITNDNVDDRNPAISNGSDKIAWSCLVQITVMNIDGTDRKRLDYGQNPSWSPNSEFLVYSNANQDFTKEVIWRINIDGSNKIQLTF